MLAEINEDRLAALQAQGHETPTADIAGCGINHGQRISDSHSRIDRISALRQNLRARIGGEMLGRHHHAVTPRSQNTGTDMIRAKGQRIMGGAERLRAALASVVLLIRSVARRSGNALMQSLHKEAWYSLWGQGEDFAAIGRHADLMLELGRQGAVTGDSCPAIIKDLHVRTANVQHRLDREDHAFHELHTSPGLP